MAAKPARRSLAAFAATAPASAPIAVEEPLPMTAELPIDSVFPSPLNPRRNMAPDGLAELAGAIVAQGLLQSLLVRPAGDGSPRYEIIAGARRWSAAKLARDRGDLPAEFRLPCRIRPCSDEELVTLAATENLAREDMHPLDEAEVFEALRKTARPRKGETAEGAVGRILGRSERTIWRRLALLKLADPLRDALRRGEITMQQAGVFVLGDPKAQAKHFRAMTKKGAPEWESEPHSIRRAMLQERIPADAALFDRALYTGEAVTDEDGQEFLVDRTAFLALQAPALEAKLAALRREFPWVERIDGAHMPQGYDYAHTPGEKKLCGAFVFVQDGGVKVRVESQYAKRADLMAHRRAAHAKAVGKGGAAAPAEAPRALTEKQLVAVKAAKTKALRLAVSDRPKVALALTLLGLLGGRGVHIRHEASLLPESKVERTKLEQDRAAKRLAPIAAAVKKAESGKRDLYGGWSEAGQAGVFRALLALELDALLEILASLAADRVGCWFEYRHAGAKDVGDSALEIAIAEETDAKALLGTAWAPGEDYFKAYSRDALQRLAAANGLLDGFHDKKKGELVADFAGQKHGFWSPTKFSELAFADDAAIRTALAGAAPVAQPGGAEDAQ